MLPGWLIEARVPPPAFLVVGPSIESARAWARALFFSRACDARSEEGCGTCRVCRTRAAGTHPDWVEAESGSRGVEDLRGLLGRLAYAPTGPIRVVFLGEVGTLSPAGVAALLKSIEEPPPATVFVLHTANPLRVLPTIRSRAFRVVIADSADGTPDPLADALLRAVREPRAWPRVGENLGKATGKDARELILSRIRSVRRELGADFAAATRLAAFARALARETPPKLARHLLAPSR